MDLHLPGLTPWLAQRRWFGGKDRPLAAVDVDDTCPLGDGLLLVLLRVTYADGGAPDTYALHLARVPDAPRGWTWDGAVVGELEDVPAAVTGLLDVISRGTTATSTAGTAFAGRPLQDPGTTGTHVRAMGVEQSNTSLVVDDAVVVKLVRKIEPGPNPEVELTAALTEAGYTGTPAQVGALVRVADEAALAVATRFVAGARGAWEAAVEEAGRGGGPLLDAVDRLGGDVAAMHLALADAFGVTTTPASHPHEWAAVLREEWAATLERARSSAAEAVRPLLVRADEVAAALPAAGDLPAGMPQIRVHGDLHLGQVLVRDDGGWALLDFEGEPARPLRERRRPDLPLRDVAGMVRSFAYVELAAVRAGGDPAAARAWSAAAQGRFVDSYLAAAAPLLADDGAARRWLTALTASKALYELRYELANRPDWAPIPVKGLLDMADARQQQGRAAEPATGRDGPTGAHGGVDESAYLALAQGRHTQPHQLLGRHHVGDEVAVRCWRPDATSAELLLGDTVVPAEQVHPGLFEARVAEMPEPADYRWRVTYPDGATFELVDPYGFTPTLGEVDLHLAGEGRHEELWTRLGANVREHQGVEGVAFAVWAPNAQAVRVVGDFNSWDGRLHPMRALGATGIWELFLPVAAEGSYYKFELVTAQGELVTRADPMARWTEVPPGQASRVHRSTHVWGDEEWMRTRPVSLHDQPLSIYEVHMASWRRPGGQPLGYRQLAHELADYCTDLGFTHVELLPPAEHPFGGSWGYQVTGYFAPTSRFGDPDDFRYLVDHLHQRGIGVIVDWVPAHFPKDEWALARFDGTALYEHADPRQGEHPDWGTLVFNFGRNEVRNFLLASALFWLEAMHCDGLRVDAVASMLYLDYSREEGQWVPNVHGGRENLDAVSFLQDFNRIVYGRNPGAVTIAEESTAWPGVSRPAHLGGLGFGFKWNMGWMHDTLSYFAKEPIYRRWHHNQLSFGLMYAWSENFILPLSHDEVVHGKGSLLGKMPGDAWQQFANLRALYGWMWGHPGKQLLFMGGEIAQGPEWSEERELDWWQLSEPLHAGVQRLVRDLNATYRAHPALWRRDVDPGGFAWIDANNADENLISFVRYGAAEDAPVAVIANFSPVPREGAPIGLPRGGWWQEVLNTDSEVYGGGNVGNLGGVDASGPPWHGMATSARVTVPPLGVVWLAHRG